MSESPGKSGLSIAWRMTIVGLAQLAIVTVIAIGIAAITMPPHRDDDGPPSGVRGGPPPGLDDRRPPPGGPHDDVHRGRPGDREHRGPPPRMRDGPPPGRRGPFAGPLLTVLAGVVVVGVGSYLSGRWIVRPLASLSRAARAIGEGDLSARTRLDRDDEIGDVAVAFDDMAARVEALVRAERELLANVSHELRTPLARIRVAMDLAAEGDAESARALVVDIATDLAELESIVDDILVAMRFDVDHSGSDRSRVARGGGAATGLPMSSLLEMPAADIAARSVERFRARHPARTIDASLDGTDRLVMIDPSTFRRVLDNLLENAEKYSPDRDRPIALRVRDDGEAHVLFEVEDHGIGIAPDDLPNVFRPFFRGDRSRSRGAGGVGLGLALAERIVHAHGGTIAIESEPGRGTTVRVRVPVRVVPS